MRRSWWRSAAFASATGVTIAGAVTGSDALQRVAKPLIVPSLALGIDPRRNALLLVGLAAATVGDVLLIDPDDDAKLQRGAGSFAVMQACYTTLLRRRGARITPSAALPRIGGWAVAVASLATRSPATAPTLAAYGLALATTSTLAADPGVGHGGKVIAGLVIPTRNPATWLGLGGVLFTVSDALIVVRRLFLRADASRRITEGAILATYAGAQYLLVEGLRE